MPYSETPIFPGKVDNGQATCPASSAATTVIYTAPASFPAVIKGIVMYEKGSGGARTCRLELKNGATVTVLKRFDTSGVQYTSTNLLTSTYIPGLDDDDPKLLLEPGESLQIVTEDTDNNALDVTVFAASYEYPN